jgi:hypothetical protein
MMGIGALLDMATLKGFSAMGSVNSLFGCSPCKLSFGQFLGSATSSGDESVP